MLTYIEGRAEKKLVDAVRKKLESIKIGALNLQQESLGAVSYTHLDVYKRQLIKIEQRLKARYRTFSLCSANIRLEQLFPFMLAFKNRIYLKVALMPFFRYNSVFYRVHNCASIFFCVGAVFISVSYTHLLTLRERTGLSVACCLYSSKALSNSDFDVLLGYGSFPWRS